VFKQLLKNRRTTSDYLDHADFNQEIKGIDEAHEKEKITAKKERGSVDEVGKGSSVEENPPQPAAEEVQKSHMKLVIPPAEVKALPAEGTDERAELEERLLYYKSLAQNKVATTVKFVVESTRTEDIVSDLSKTVAADMRGEIKTHASDGTAYHASTIMIIFDQNLCSEALTHPHLRTPPLKDGRLARLVQIVLQARVLIIICEVEMICQTI
jgi:hypothetical protein